MVEIIRSFRALEHGEQQEEIACPLCGSTSDRLILKARDLLFGRPGEYRLAQCLSCNLKYVNPRPTRQALNRHYPDRYYEISIQDNAPSFIQPFIRAFSDGISKRRVAYLERVIGRIAPETEVLDVGCGTNLLLSYIKRARGCQGLGLDFNRMVVQYVRDQLKMPIVHGTLQTADFQAARFDLVTMMEYLEHEADPRAVLQKARLITRMNGHLALELPDSLGLPARILRSLWWNLDLPRHLVFFTPDTLRRILDECGFELLTVKRFTLPLYIGLSLGQVFGQRHWAKNWRWVPVLSTLLGAPFLPFQIALPEFIFAIARAK
ncbi:MAG: class I SAM-dependent methyltransferase [Deltaproteobacteria bacterium]|nr:class I SAM-dependent methyltransferase [Deltaproteobacteria bacterium]